MKVFVTGGSGFIGRHLCWALVREGHSVTVGDVRNPLMNGVDFVPMDITRPETIPNLRGYNAVVHLAAVLGVANSEKNPMLTLDVNIDGVRNILNSCIEGEVERFLFTSSSEVYGEPARTPIREDDFFNPVSPYGVSKIVGEEYVKVVSKTSGMKYNIFRLFSVYGPGQSPEFVMPRFVQLAMENKTLTVHGDGTQTRAFCYVSDVVDAMLLAIKNPMNEVFNIGNSSEPVTIEKLAKKVIDVTESTSKVEFVKEEDSGRGRKRDIYHRIPDTEKAANMLGFKAKVGLEEGISRLADSVRGS
ncbi:MAG: NAD-dependent epimerase/dehydratase family protein [Candidatus Aenigmarchaeota archaeon]|nr:NAD-dependent epimerase/dehydratase family protein [Candidatus Aenigmarchaeota archaeon]